MHILCNFKTRWVILLTNMFTFMLISDWNKHISRVSNTFLVGKSRVSGMNKNVEPQCGNSVSTTQKMKTKWHKIMIDNLCHILMCLRIILLKIHDPCWHLLSRYTNLMTFGLCVCVGSYYFSCSWWGLLMGEMLYWSPAYLWPLPYYYFSSDFY